MIIADLSYKDVFNKAVEVSHRFWLWGDPVDKAPWIVCFSYSPCIVFRNVWKQTYGNTQEYPIRRILSASSDIDNIRGYSFETPVIMVGYKEYNYDKEFEKILLTQFKDFNKAVLIRI